MQIFTNIKQIKDLKLNQSSITIGSFDGFHVGHRNLINKVFEGMSKKNCYCLTFDPHPAKIFAPDQHQPLFDKQDQLDILESLGFSGVFYIPFSKSFSQIKPQEFIQNYIWEPFAPKKLVVGYDFVFGHQRQGDLSSLKDSLAPLGVQVLQVDPFRIDGQIVSSTLIRTFLLEGDLKKVEQFLGRAYYLKGRVISGLKLGRSIGVPTVNLSLEDRLIPQEGVYAAHIFLRERSYLAVGNIGSAPTVGLSPQKKIEFHILDFSGDLYGQELKFHLVKKIREEKKFNSLDDLKVQIHKDIEDVRLLKIN